MQKWEKIALAIVVLGFGSLIMVYGYFALGGPERTVEYTVKTTGRTTDANLISVEFEAWFVIPKKQGALTELGRHFAQTEYDLNYRKQTQKIEQAVQEVISQRYTADIWENRIEVDSEIREKLPGIDLGPIIFSFPDDVRERIDAVRKSK